MCVCEMWNQVNGAIIMKVLPETPAARAGLRRHDVVRGTAGPRKKLLLSLFFPFVLLLQYMLLLLTLTLPPLLTSKLGS